MFYQGTQYLTSFVRRLHIHESYLEHDISHYLMQYTGLKDKNGKEIYEGDIVLNKYGNVCEMVFRHHGFYYTRPGWKTRLAHPNGEELEVVGNIYENPELLTSAP